MIKRDGWRGNVAATAARDEQDLGHGDKAQIDRRSRCSDYIADLCLELEWMARKNGQQTLAALLALAAREARESSIR